GVLGTTAMTASSIYNAFAGNTHSGDDTQYVDAGKTDLRSRTHYFGNKGDELADYSQSWMIYTYLGNMQIKDTTVYVYGTDEAGVNDILSATLTYKGGEENVKIDPDFPGSFKLKNANHYVGALRGEEILDYGYAYTGNALSSVSTTTVYFYGTMFGRASTSRPSSTSMTASALYNGEYSGGAYSDGKTTDIKSKTHYVGYKGEELADYTQSFMVVDSAGTVDIKETTIYEYKIDVPTNTRMDVLASTTTYKSGTLDSKSIQGRTKKASSIYYGDIRGEEMLLYSQTFGNDTDLVSTTTVYYYGTANKRADESASVAGNMSLKCSEVYNKDYNGASFVSLLTAATDLKSKTFYKGYKGDELVDYAQNFISVSGSVVVKDTIMYSYTNYDVLNYVTTFKSGTINVRNIAGLTLKSRLYYVGALRGEELQNLLRTYSGDSGQITATNTFYYYGTNHDRASTALALGPSSVAM
nr:hypothetical protein [Candidatus Omnitrophota bacterium]